LPKQYQQVQGKPVVQHTLDAMAQVRGVAQMVVVLAPHDALFAPLCQLPDAAQAAYCGGASRAETVAQGLAYLRENCGAKADDWVLVHDAARCLVQPVWVEALMQTCLQADIGGLLAIPVADTLKMASADAVQPRVAQTVDRAGKWLAQTPQMFRISDLQDALARAPSSVSVSDEASAMEAAGHAPLLVPGHTHNFKVTYPEDFVLAEAVLGLRTQQKHKDDLCKP
jgi:2-C-methyl-D-erythritol 4-phosphate cytidylyltransferase